jgi:hypothetical protein
VVGSSTKWIKFDVSGRNRDDVFIVRVVTIRDEVGDIVGEITLSDEANAGVMKNGRMPRASTLEETEGDVIRRSV